ncbi:MAG: hypothetical protein MUC81_12025 [Bacteroidia bacterium]|nr:hypothetical protein [Bacteroidia bacterium]
MKRLIKNTICLLCLMQINSSILKAQEKPYREPTGLNNWYVELGGAALLYSINYERILYKSSSLGWTGRLGMSYGFAAGRFLNSIDLNRNSVISPFTTSLLLGSSDRKEKLEIGGGFTLITKSPTEQEIAYSGILGFRVIETNKVCFRISYTPIIREGKFQNWFGVSIGKNFAL